MSDPKSLVAKPLPLPKAEAVVDRIAALARTLRCAAAAASAPAFAEVWNNPEDDVYNA